MSAYEQAKAMGREEVMGKIAALGIPEAGLCAEPLSERLCASLREAEEEGAQPGVVAALNNADTDFALLDVLRDGPERVMEGISIAALAIGAQSKVLCVPEREADLAESLRDVASKYQVEVRAEFVDVRASKGKALLHIVTAADLADAFSGSYVPGVYVAVNGERARKVPLGTKVADLLGEEAMAEAKALILGYEMRAPEAASLEVEKAGIANGVVRSLTSRDCVVAETERRLLASLRQSCGKCVFCREGLIQLQYMQKEITEGRGKAEFADLTEEIGEAMGISTPCTMGQNSARAALSAMRSFPAEYEAHVRKKRCPSAVCVKLVNIYVDPKRCDGCGACVDVCPHGCIEGQLGYIHMVDDFDCDKCGKCQKACAPGAVVITTGRVPRLPSRPTKAGRFR